MPTVPRQEKCIQLGCGNPRTKLSSNCLEHGGRNERPTYKTDKRDAANAFYQTRQWKTLRAAKLSTDPLCQSCFVRGIIAQATEVDHIFAWQHIGPQAFYRNLFQTLCHDCHSTKTQMEKRGVYMDYRNNVATKRTITDYNRLVGNQS